MQKIAKLDLSKLTPQESKFKLSSFPDKEFHLCPHTLRVQAWAFGRFGRETMEKMIANRSIIELAELGFFQLKEKAQFKTLDAFMDAVVTYPDRDALATAVLESIGLSQPVLEDLNRQIEAQQSEQVGNEESPAPTGQVSSTH